MNIEVRNVLIDVDRNRQVIHYQELSDRCRLGLNMHDNPSDRLEIGRILGEISEYEHNNNRPLISSLVITKSGEECDGFYKLCEKLGIASDWEKLKRDGVFAAMEIKECHEYWRNNEYYQKYK